MELCFETIENYAKRYLRKHKAVVPEEICAKIIKRVLIAL